MPGETHQQYEKAKDITPEDELLPGLKVSNMPLGKSRGPITNSSRKNEMTRQKNKQHSTADVCGGRSQVRCCKEQYCTGTWNVKFTKQGKLDVLKQEMARLNIYISGISELKWMEMGKF